MVEIKDIIEQNPWWRIKNWEEFDKHLLALRENSFQIKRKEFKIMNKVNLIYGPRQVGKTTFLKLMIKKLIEEKISPEKIAYFSCDTLITNKREELREAINFFLERETNYLFIDEISNVDGWGYEIKYFIDAGKFDSLAVFITGSPFGMHEHLPGRKLNHFYLMPITFREFLENLTLNLKENVKKAFNLKESEVEEIKTFNNILPSLVYNFTDSKNLKKNLRKTELYSPLLGKLFYFYLLMGGFPSVINSFIKYKTEKNRAHLLEEIKTSKERLIDSIRKSGKNEGICFQLINSVKKRLSSRYSFTELKETEIDLSKETIIHYLNHLKNVFILKVIYAYDFGKREVGWKKNKKIYLLDPFLYHDEKILEMDNILAEEEYLSKIVESVTAINLSYLKEDFLNPLESFLFFWYNAQEIDFVFDNKDIFAIEVKFRRRIDKIYKISQIKKYITLTKNLLKFDKEEVFIPVFLFLILLKNADCYL